MTDEKRKFLTCVKIPLIFVSVTIIVKVVEFLFNLNFVSFGIYPRTFTGLRGIFFAPLIHANINHLYSNIPTLFVLGTSVFYFYPEISKKVVILIYLFTGMLVWCFARQNYHIGASGILYGLFFFLFFSGIFRKDRRSITLSVLTLFFYGSIAYGIFPVKEEISWESHLFGSIIGIFTAYIFRKKDVYKQYDWEDEEEDFDVRNLKISHKNFRNNIK